MLPYWHSIFKSYSLTSMFQSWLNLVQSGSIIGGSIYSAAARLQRALCHVGAEWKRPKRRSRERTKQRTATGKLLKSSEEKNLNE